jgi:predicted CXXCH cytochrome family protein
MRVALRPEGRAPRTLDTTRPYGHSLSLLRVPLVSILALALVVVCARGASAQDSAKEEIETCLSCHADDSLSVTFADGTSHALAVDQHAFARSVHGGNLKCTDCHAGMGEIPHPERQYTDLQQFRASFREACKSCHFDNYTQSLDGVHQTLLARGDTRAPACADCHGSHAIVPAGKPRAAISRTCARCHEPISAVYVMSVHGTSLANGNNDVPVCTDCHRSHDIADPRSTAWLVKTPELCGKCHTNKPLMAKYGLSPNVVSTYLADFHGMSASLTNRSGATADKERLTALCIDCHGVHNITRVEAPDSPVLKANLVNTCRKCHEGAPEAFPAAWLSHYEPSWQKAPIVYSVTLFYRLFIPFVIGGLVLQILLHLWRLVVNR